MVETIKSYATSDIGASQSLVTLEGFIGDADGAELADDSVFDVSDAVTAVNGLIFSLEQRDAEIARLTAENERLRAASWSILYDASGASLYIVSAANRPARAIEMNGGAVFRYAYDNGDFVGVTLTNLPAVEGNPYERDPNEQSAGQEVEP